MLTRLQRALRLFIAVMALSGGVLGAAEPVVAAPSCYPAALSLPSRASASVAAAARPELVRKPVAAPPPPAADPVRKAAAPTLTRAPRLYLRHCVLLR